MKNKTLGGFIDPTVFCVDYSDLSGLGFGAEYHYFNQLLSYDIKNRTLSIEPNGKQTNPSAYSFNLRLKDYVLGSVSDDTLAANKAPGDLEHGAYVFAGDGNDTIRVYSGSASHTLSNDGLINLTVDRICGGKGNDVIKSSSLGSQQCYIYSDGDGYDRIEDFCGADTIQLYGMTRESIWWKESYDAGGAKFYDIYQGDNQILRVSQYGVGHYTLRLDDAVVATLSRNLEKMQVYTAHCPVDMQIYDASDKLVLTLKDGQSMDTYTAYGHFIVELEDGEYTKTAKFFEDDYYFKLVGTGTGTMEYSVCTVDEEGAQTRAVYEIPVQAGAVYTVPENSEQVILQGDLDNDGTIDYEAAFVAPEAITLNQTRVSLNIKETFQLTAAVNPGDAHQAVYWTSSDTGVVSVDQTGKLTACDVGTAKISAVSEKNSTVMAECTVTVGDTAVQVTSVSVSASQILLGDSVTLTAQCTGEGAPTRAIWTVWPMEYVDGSWVKSARYIYRGQNQATELTYRLPRAGWYTVTLEITNANDRVTTATSQVFEGVAKPCDHSYVTDPGKEPTCTEAGITEGSHCELCGVIRVSQKVLAALGHQEITREDKEPTCTEAGYIGGTHCNRCGKVLTAGKVLSALRHKGEKQTIQAVSPTDTTPGNKKYDVYFCIRCDAQVDKKNRGLTEAEIAKIIADNTTYPKTREVTMTLGAETVTGTRRNWDMSILGNQVTLEAEYVPNAAKPNLAWSTSSKGVATVKNGAVVFGKPGTVKITAAATDGSKKSAIVTFDVIYKDAAKNFTGNLAKTTNLFGQPIKNGLQVRDSVDILVYGTDKTRPLEDLTYEIISGGEFASLKGNTVTALVAGKTVKVKAYWEGDPLKRSYTATIKTKATIPGQMRISRGTLAEKDIYGYILSDGFQNTDGLPVLLVAKGSADKKFTIDLKAWDQTGSSMDDDNGVTWSTSSSKIATVKEDKAGVVTITVRKNVGGEVTITAKSKLDKTVVTTMTVRVVDYVPKLTAKSVTLNTALVDATMPIPLTWEDADDVGDVVFVDRKGNPIPGITVSYNPKKAIFVVNNPQIAMKNGSYSGKLKLITRMGQDLELNFTVKVTNKTPSVTVKQTRKLNLLDPNSFAAYTISSKQGTVSKIVLSQDMQLTPSGADNQFRLEYAEGIENLLKTDVRGKVDIYVEGYKNPVNKSLNVGTEKVKNKAVLKNGTIKLYRSIPNGEAVTDLTSYFVGGKVDDCVFSPVHAQGKKIDVVCKDGVITASFRDQNNLPPKGTYSFTAVPSIAGTPVAKVTLKVTVAVAPPK